MQINPAGRRQSGASTWHLWNVADDNGAHFPTVGQRYVAEEGVRQGKIGDAESMLFPMRGLVDFAVRYFDDVL